MKHYYIILIVIGSLILLHLIFSYVIFKYGFYMSKRRRLKFHEECKVTTFTKEDINGNTWRDKQTFEHIYLKSFDNIKLHAELLENKNSKGTIIFFHGFFGSNFNRTSDITRRILETNNFNILFADQRGFHLSEGCYSTLGYKEKDDVKTWVDYINKRYNNLPIIIYGFSLGAGTVLLSTYQELPNVKLVIADSGYHDAYKMFKLKLARTLKFDSKILADTVNLYARIFGHFNMKDANISKSLKNNKTMPIVYIHGTCDDYVPCKDSTINKNNTLTEHDIFIFEGAEHVRSYNRNPDEYIDIINKSIKKYLG